MICGPAAAVCQRRRVCASRIAPPRAALAIRTRGSRALDRLVHRLLGPDDDQLAASTRDARVEQLTG